MIAIVHWKWLESTQIFDFAEIFTLVTEMVKSIGYVPD